MKGFPLGAHRGAVCVGFSPDGRICASTGRVDGRAFFYDVATKKLLWSWSLPVITCFAISPDNNLLIAGVSAKYRDTCRVLDISSGAEKRRLIDDTGFRVISTFAWRDQRTLVSLADRGFSEESLLFDFVTGSLIWENRPAAEALDGRHLSALVGGRLWDVTTGAPLAKYPSHADLFGTALNRDGSRAVSQSSREGFLWDTRRSALVTTFDESSWMWAAAFSPDDRFLLTATDTRLHSLSLRDASSGKRITFPEGHSDAVVSVAFSPDGSHALSGDKSGRVFLWTTP